MANVKKAPLLRATQALFYLNAAIWVLFATTTVIGMMAESPAQTATIAVLGALMFGNAAALLVVGLGLASRKRWPYVMALTIVAANILLTVTDQFGLPDLIILVLDVVLLGLLVADRRSYAKSG